MKNDQISKISVFSQYFSLTGQLQKGTKTCCLDYYQFLSGLGLCWKPDDRKPTIQKNLEVHQEEGA